MSTPDSIVVCMSGWTVDDGDPEVRVGASWAPTIEVERSEPVTDDDWYPPVTGVDDGRLPALVPAGLSDGLPTYQFVADALSVDRSDTGEWTALSVGPYAFAVPGIHEGRVEGGGVLRYDTHMIEGDEVLSAIGRRLEVVRVQRLRRGYLRQPDGTMLALPHEPAADVASTRQVRPAQRFGENVTFLIYLTPTTGLRPA